MITTFNNEERYELCNLAHKTLMQEDTEETFEAYQYLTYTRGLSRDVLEKFRFGYIPRRVNHDWSERIIMPLFDSLGKLVVLTSRKFRAKNKEEMPHLHEQFDKKRYIYGIHAAKRFILKWNAVLLVEGQFDTCRLQSNGLLNTVGILGSSLTFNHVCQLRRYCTDFYMLFDRDKAGCLNTIRAMKMYNEKSLSSFDINFIPIRLPKSTKDPDDFVNQFGVKKLNKLIRSAKDSDEEFVEKEWYDITSEAAS